MILDCDFTQQEALEGSPAPDEILAVQQVVAVSFWGFEKLLHRGQIVVHRDLAAETAEIFQEILAARFPIFSVIPVCAFDWSDDASMEANNSSGFNFRPVVGAQRLSHHATGRAIDINPRQNPYLKNGLVLPPGAKYEPTQAGTLVADGPVFAAFERRGWEWGGRWNSFKDWHHFQKPG